MTRTFTPPFESDAALQTGDVIDAASPRRYSAGMTAIEVREVRLHESPRGNLRDFLGVVDRIYAGDSAYVRPLDQDLKDRLDPKKNPFFTHAEGAIFTAHKDGACVGRITTSIDHEHLARYKDSTGFWGFLDTIDDAEVTAALLARAEQWLRDKGMTRARGPMSTNVNEEIGCLVDGFDTPPYVLMPHHRPYQAKLIEQAGYAKAKDLLAWRYTVGDLNPRVSRARDDIRAMPEVTSRVVSYGDMQRDVALIMDIFNDAWSDNWGFVPLTEPEIKKTAQDFKLFLMPEITRIVSINGEPAAVAVAIPNLNEMIPDLGGKLFPLGLPKLLYRLKVKGPKTGRVIILGIAKKWRHVRKYAGLSLFLYAELNESGKKLGMTGGELGWTLEDNGPVNTGIRTMGAKPYKRYRIFDKALVSLGAGAAS